MSMLELNRLPSSVQDAPASQSRRGFLQAGGAVVITFAFPVLASAQTATPKEKIGLYTGLDSWLAVDPDGHVTIFCGKVELGQGVQTSLSQAVAEELDCPMSQISMIMGDTAIVPDQGTTTGSKTTQMGQPQLRQAAAEARAVIIELGAAKLGVSQDAVGIRRAVVFVKANPSQGVTFAELLGGRRFERKMTGKVKFKAVADYTVIGQPVPRVDLPEKAVGSFEYVHNIRLPGMLHGRVVRPAAIGAKLISVDENSVRALGARVVTRGDFVGVVAAREETAIAAARQLKVQWKLPANAGEAVDTHKELRTYPVAQALDVKVIGDPAKAFAGAAKTVKATYLTPFQMHGSIGPSCGVADVRKDRATVWCGTQHSYGLIDTVARILNLPSDKVRVAWTEASGCYGHNGADDSAVDAALLSQATGKPVRVQWMRQDEHGWEPKCPAMVVDLMAGVDAKGNVVAWDFINITATHSSRPRGQAGNTLGGTLTGFKPNYEYSNGGRNADINYVFPDRRVRIRYHDSSPLRPSALRGLSAYPHTFANESFMDELAFAARADPVAYRLQYLKDPRARDVVTAVAKMAKWHAGQTAQTPSSAQAAPAKDNISRGRGVAFSQYENENAYTGVIVDVEVDHESGKVRVTHMYAAFDCGLIVNPDGARNQVEGCLIQGMSRAIFEEVAFNRGGVTSTDWNSYPIVRFEDVPEVVEVQLINRLDKASCGAGEASTTPVAAAIGNAIFNATGARLREYPFNPARVKNAITNHNNNGAII
jgi:nicotinate dehydrogenase subunit B